MYQNFIIPYLYEAQHVSGDTPPIIRSLKLHWQGMIITQLVYNLNVSKISELTILTHCGQVTQICVYTLQLCKTDEANLRF
jgi:hypothetical protein